MVAKAIEVDFRNRRALDLNAQPRPPSSFTFDERLAVNCTTAQTINANRNCNAFGNSFEYLFCSARRGFCIATLSVRKACRVSFVVRLNE